MRTRRIGLGLYQKEVAAILGVTEDSVCYWENNRVKPSRRIIAKIVQFLEW
ncbi:MAG: helix-turn-helix transcriptional regulator [Pyrinomonadaceae bacterium]